MKEKKEDPGFVVKDKRLFGESTDEQPQEEPKADAREEKKESAEKQGQTYDHSGDYPPVNFTNFVLSLSTSALFHFGDFPDPEGGEIQKNMAAAKQTIDILDMLNEKTKGNLDQNESSLIQGVLYELKMRFIKEKV